MTKICAVSTALLTGMLLIGCDNPVTVSETQTIQTDPATSPALNNADVGVAYYGMQQDLQRFSSLTQVNDQNVNRLTPAWVLSLGDIRGQQTQPIVIDGIMYVTTHNATFAIDAITGRQLWRTTIEYPPDTVTCCGITNRGATWHAGILYRATLDNRIQAINPENGQLIWETLAADIKEGYSMTSAPLVANDVLITGIAGGEFGVRGFLDGRALATGEHLWRFHTLPEPGQPGGDTWNGDDWRRGGGPTWLIGSYDSELDMVYWGIGNAAPWNSQMRPGDNLYTNSIVAIRPKTGELVWHFQFTPNDPFDYDGVNDPILADINIHGLDRKVLIQANRNGYFYVIDRTNGEFLKANQFVDKVTWAKGIDIETGRPIRPEAVSKMLETNETIEIWPSAFGGKNLAPMSYSPLTGLAYANTFNIGWNYTPIEQEYKPGVFYTGIKFEWLLQNEFRGYLKAIEPLTGKTVWQFPSEVPMNGGTLVTAGNLVFSGAQTGELYAFNAKTGNKLWEYRTGSGIVAPPVTYQLNSKQYVAVASGLGGVYRIFVDDAKLKNINPGGSIWVFALGSGENNSTLSADTIPPPVIPKTQLVRDDKTTWSDTIKQGAALYQQACSHCHGVEMRTSGSTYDLRVFPKDDKQRFIDAVTRGKGEMPAWGNKLSDLGK